MNIRTLIPAPFRLQYQLVKRYWKDVQQKGNQPFAQKNNQKEKAFSPQIDLEQPVKKSAFAANKVFNIQKASDSIASYIVEPGEMFSFWKAVGPPSRRKGFKEGRNIVNGELKKGYGGGLCQLSGIVYHLALTAGLEVAERHHHSMDIYKEEDRFCPLGSDATVVYGYKDLRLRNNLEVPVRFSFKVNEKSVSGILETSGEIIKRNVEFLRKDQQDKREVITIFKENGKNIEIARSVYGIAPTTR